MEPTKPQPTKKTPAIKVAECFERLSIDDKHSAFEYLREIYSKEVAKEKSKLLIKADELDVILENLKS